MFVAAVLRQCCRPKTLILALLSLISLAHISCIFHAIPKNDFGIKIKNFGQINPNYYRGSQIEESDAAVLGRLGIRTVIDLQKNGSNEESDSIRDAGMNYFRIPLSTTSPATAEQTDHFLRLVDDPGHWPVYVHCAAGRHRTGAMTAIYRITRDDWTADQAYDEMKKYGYYSFPNHGSLKDYVFEYYRNRLGATPHSKSDLILAQE